MNTSTKPNLDVEKLRSAIRHEYEIVANDPGHGFHFPVGRPLAERLGYEAAHLDRVPAESLESFAGTGNPFQFGALKLGETVVDMGSGAGTDSLIAAAMVGREGSVIGVDMTPGMVEKARASAAGAGIENVLFKQGAAESLPVLTESADVVISNGVFNLVPDKAAALEEVVRVLKPGGRLQFGDILVQKEVPAGAKENIELWTS